MANSKNEFWVEGDRRSIGSLEIKDDQSFGLNLDNFIVTPKQVTPIEGGLAYSADPGEIVTDYKPRTIYGELDDGTLVTLLGAHMEPGPALSFNLQRFTGQAHLMGAHITDDFELVRGIRWLWNIAPDAFGETAAGEAVDGGLSGSLSVWAPDGQNGSQKGLEFNAQELTPLRDLLQIVQASSNQLIGLWDGRHRVPQIVLTEIRVGDKWCRYRTSEKGDARQIKTALLPLKELSLKTFADWIPFARSIDPFPYIANAELTNLQVDAQMLATALEGIHRRLYAAEKPFAGMSNLAVTRAMKKARKAGVRALEEEGFTDSELAEKRLRDTLNFVNQPTYYDRVLRLATDISEIAPGLCAPDVHNWVTRIKNIRNQQSHQLVEDFQEIHIAEYHVAGLTARWVLSLAILVNSVVPERLTAALKMSDNFHFMLANADAEGLWDDFSALETFRTATPTNGDVEGPQSA